MALSSGIDLRKALKSNVIEFFYKNIHTLGDRISDFLPKGLYARALIIIITPIVILESVLAFVFMDRHWQLVTRRLSEATARDIAALTELYETYTDQEAKERIVRLAQDKLSIIMQIHPLDDLPPPTDKPFFPILDRALSRELERYVQRPFWIDTIGDNRLVEIQIRHDNSILRFITQKNRAYASNSYIFLIWMLGTAFILLSVAIIFLRNQIRPILRLAEAADAFGKGRPLPEDFRPRGAREVRLASESFIEMRNRISQHVEQRTTMLAGVSHDLRTILTRLKLELAFLPDSSETRSMKSDVKEMQHMLEDYLAFARGDEGEESRHTNLRDILEEIHQEAMAFCTSVEIKTRRHQKELFLPLKRNAFKRALSNLVSNAVRYGDKIVIRAATEGRWLRVEVDDNGPGIPSEERENVFRPFYRIDAARNQDSGNSGLGLAIARDIVKSHGGSVTLGESSMGGLRAIISVPL
ncbi:MAG: ATP-binding protein [Hyphomicrobium sp.]